MAETDDGGRARLGGLDPEVPFDLVVSPYRADLLAVERAGWTPADETIRLPKAYAIEGHVVDGDGKPIPESEVWIREREDRDPPNPTPVDAEGRFTIPVRRNGPVWLAAKLRNTPGFEHDRPPPTGYVEVPTGRREAVLTIEDPGAMLDVRIDGWVDPEEYVVAWLEEQQDDTRLAYAHGAVQGGRVVFRGLDAGACYTLWIHGGTAGCYVLVHDVAPRTEPLAVLARRGSTIRGRVVSPPGPGDAGSPSVLAFSVAGRHLADGEVAPDGTFEIAGLPEGEWELWARLGSGMRTHEAKRTVRAGTEDVVLRLTPTPR